MSMKSWSEYGYGFPLFNGKNIEHVVQFIISNGEYQYSEDELKELLEICEAHDEGSLWDFFDEPVSWLVAKIINEKEGMAIVRGYGSCGDTDQEEYLGVEPCYPWQMGKGYRKLKSENDAAALLTEYMEKLGVDGEPDYFEARYLG